MTKTKQHTKADKARKKWQLLQEEQEFLKLKANSKEKTIPLKVAHKRQKATDPLADSA